MLDLLRARGASFVHEIASACRASDDQIRAALGALVAAGLASSDGFAGLRAIAARTASSASARARRIDSAGRWFAIEAPDDATRDQAVEMVAWALLRRYGVVFRRVLARETCRVSWRELAQVYRRLEARGEIRGGRFVSGFSGEQFALPEAVDRLREIRRTPPDDALIVISAADPLNLHGIVTPGERIRAAASTRIVYRNGVAIAAMEGGMLRTLADVDSATAAQAAAAAAGRRVPVVTGFVGRAG